MLKNILIVATLALVACDPPPAWEPGDASLRVWAPEDATWAVFAAGCERWDMTGITCVREKWRSDATVEVVAGEASPGAAADTLYNWEFGWDYEVIFAHSTIEVGGDFAAAVAAHEVGHLLGIWHHLEEPGVLMNAGTSAPGPTDIDIDALPFSIE